MFTWPSLSKKAFFCNEQKLHIAKSVYVLQPQMVPAKPSRVLVTQIYDPSGADVIFKG